MQDKQGKQAACLTCGVLRNAVDNPGLVAPDFGQGRRRKVASEEWSPFRRATGGGQNPAYKGAAHPFVPLSRAPRRATPSGMTSNSLPACGFKEWSLVCDALGAGAQSIILRKGGIHEGRSGFYWKHDTFFLFPTHFHEQSLQFPWPEAPPLQPRSDEDAHVITLFASVEWKAQITAWEDVARLRDFHFWTDETIRERFDYTDDAGISLAFLRVWRLAEPWGFPHLARYGGCRSWLDLPEVPRDGQLSPVLTDELHAQRLAAVRAALPAL